ncbi:hypothetical protein AHF37_10990 [Paragonimus kellicotti]|nr:hypothetical protein AHF37_10990 [Paragonimus kellicotti]
MGISKLPFAPNFDIWLRRIETIVAVNCGIDSTEYCYTIKQIKLWCPTYDGLKLNCRCLSAQNTLVNKQHEKKATQKRKPYNKPNPVTDGQLLNSPCTKPTLLGPLTCMSGPPAEQCGQFNFTSNLKSVMDIPTHKSVDRVELRTDQYSDNTNLGQSRNSWLEKRAASIVQRVLTRLDLSHITEVNGPAEAEAVGERISSTTRDISSIDVLSDRVDRWTSHTVDSNTEKTDYQRPLPDAQTESPSRQLKMKQQKVKVEKSTVQNTAVFENLGFNATYKEPFDRLKEDSPERGSVKHQSKPQEKFDQFSGKDSFSMLVNRSEDSDHYLYELGTVQTRSGSPNEPHSDLTEINDYRFTVVDSSMIVTPTDDEEIKKKQEQYKTVVEWKPQKKTKHSESKLTENPDVSKLDTLINLEMIDVNPNKMNYTVLDSRTSPSAKESGIVNKKIFRNESERQNDISNQSFSQNQEFS